MKNSKRTLAFYIKQSFIVHGLLFLIVVVAGKVISGTIRGKRDFNLKLVESSVRVDVVGMPKLTLRQLRQLPRVEQSLQNMQKEGLKAHISETEFQKASDKNSLTDILKGFSTGKVEKAPRENKKRLNNQSELKKLVLAGNKMSSGSALSGNYGESSSDFESYLGSLPDKVRPHWILPSYLAGDDLKCRIRIYLDKDGKLSKAQVQESSGHDEYDSIALEAVKKTSFPKPDEKFVREVLEGKILLGFPL